MPKYITFVKIFYSLIVYEIINELFYSNVNNAHNSYLWVFYVMNKIDINKIIGNRYNRLIVLNETNPYIKPSGRIERKVLCKCDCGNNKEILLYSITSGNTKSCGCYSIETNKVNNSTHGENNKTTEWKTWCGIKSRCYGVNEKRYKDYGGRGIKVCDRWLESYSNFLEDMGRKPTPQHSIDRIDVNGNYEPQNCRWATISEQSNNKRSSHYITYKNETLTLTQWAERYNINKKTFGERIRGLKMSFEKAISF